MGEAASPLCCGGSSDDAVLPLLPLLPLLAQFLSLSYTSGSSSPLKSSFPPYPLTLPSFVQHFFPFPFLAAVPPIPLYFITVCFLPSSPFGCFCKLYCINLCDIFMIKCPCIPPSLSLQATEQGSPPKHLSQ